MPPLVGGFVGRHPELEALDGILSHSPGAIVVIAGVAGVGKTTLASHWAHRIADLFPDGQLYVNLNGYSSSPPVAALEALSWMLRSLGVAPKKIPLADAEAAAMFRTQASGRQLLVVLDNARSVDQVRPLLPAASGCFTLITSRNSLTGLLAREGAHRLSLGVLSASEAHALVANAVGRDRASAEPEAVTEVARLCGYLPLALRVSAANLHDHPYRSVAGHAEAMAKNRLESLAIEGDEASAVRAAFDMSYLEVPAAVQGVFRLLGLFPGADFSLAAAAALTGLGLPIVERHLDRLVSAHLIVASGPNRFAMHDLLRLYAQECAERVDSPSERAMAVQRLERWYLGSADRAGRLLSPELLRLPMPELDDGLTFDGLTFDEPAEALEWLDSEVYNIVAVCQAAAGRESVVAWLLPDALRGYFASARFINEWFLCAQVALDAASAAKDERAIASAHLQLAHAHRTVSKFDAAAEHLHLAIELAVEVPWPELEAACLGNLANIHYITGNLGTAADLTRRSLELNRRLGYRGGEANALCNLGSALGALGRLPEAAAHLRSAIELYQQINATMAEATTLVNLAEVLNQLGEPGAEDLLSRAMVLAGAAKDHRRELYALEMMVTVRLEAGQLSEGLALSERIVTLATQLG